MQLLASVGVLGFQRRLGPSVVNRSEGLVVSTRTGPPNDWRSAAKVPSVSEGLVGSNDRVGQRRSMGLYSSWCTALSDYGGSSGANEKRATCLTVTAFDILEPS